jgi:hypothetical protein
MSTSRRRLLGLLPALLALSLLPGPRSQAGSSAQEPARPPAGLFYPRTIIVVRHAEKGVDDPVDPSLSEEGVLRALALQRLLGSSGVTHLFATEFQRTQQTLLPLAAAAEVNLQIVPARDPRALLSALGDLPRNSLAVVAGHSNTVPGIVAALAPSAPLVQKGPEALKLEDGDYDRLFVVTQWAPDKGASVVELRY